MVLKKIIKNQLKMIMHVKRITMLGYCYDIGIETDINKKKAIELYQKAANLSSKIAQYNLSLMYLNGNYIKKVIIKLLNYLNSHLKEMI